MFFENKLLISKKIKTKHFKFKKFDNSLSDNNQTSLSFNFLVEDGKLKNGYGFSDLILPVSDANELVRSVNVGTSEKVNLWHKKQYNSSTKTWVDKLYWTTSEYYVGYIDILSYNTLCVEFDAEFESEPCAISYTLNDVDYMLFAGDEKTVKFSQGNYAITTADLPTFVDLNNAFNRLFGIVDGRRNKIYYSETLNPENWTTDEDYLELNDELGPCNKLVFFEGDLFVFRDYGITKISEYGIKNEYAVYNAFSSSSKIYGKTVVNCGENILFFAHDGLYSFNGTSVSKISTKLEKYFQDINNINATATFDGKNYILACKMSFQDGEQFGCESYESGYTNNVVVVFNVFEKTIDVVRGVDVRCLLNVNVGKISKVFATFNGQYKEKIGIFDKSGAMFGTQLRKSLIFEKQDFGDFSKTKNIKWVEAKSSTAFSLKFATEDKTKTISFSGGNKTEKKKMFLHGKEFEVSISGESASMNICPIKLEYEIEE